MICEIANQIPNIILLFWFFKPLSWTEKLIIYYQGRHLVPNIGGSQKFFLTKKFWRAWKASFFQHVMNIGGAWAPLPGEFLASFLLILGGLEPPEPPQEWRPCICWWIIHICYNFIFYELIRYWLSRAGKLTKTGLIVSQLRRHCWHYETWNNICWKKYHLMKNNARGR